jgi:hypothetical protein
LTKYLFTAILLIVLIGIINAQSLGFGFSGFFAGYSQDEYVFQQNSQVHPFISMPDQINFNKTTGYRIGANFFRAQFGDLFITAKGYYQFLRQFNSITAPNDVLTQENYQLKMNHWGVGIDIGVHLFWIFDWKIVEGNLTFFNSDFTQEEIVNNASQGVNSFNSGKNNKGYFLGSGLIIQIIQDYVSIEGTVGYNIIKFDWIMNNSTVNNPSLLSNSTVTEKGGISTTLQLNVGFPL